MKPPRNFDDPGPTPPARRTPIPLNDEPGKMFPSYVPKQSLLEALLTNSRWINSAELARREEEARRARREAPWSEINTGVYDDSADF
jgi:hypothetical protein